MAQWVCASIDTVKWYCEQIAAGCILLHLMYVLLSQVDQNGINNAFILVHLQAWQEQLTLTLTRTQKKRKTKQTKTHTQPQRFQPNIQWNTAGNFDESCGRSGEREDQLVRIGWLDVVVGDK